MKQLDCLFIGNSTEDVMMRVSRLPDSDERVVAGDFVRCCGGVSSNAAVAFHTLGGTAGVITTVGDDGTGRFIAQNFQKHGMEYLNLIPIPEAHSSISVILVEEDGKRSIVNFGGNIMRLTFEMLDPEVLKSAGMVHLGLLAPGFMLDVARFCKREGIGVSVDGGNLSREVTDELLPCCDLFIPDQATARKTLGLDPEDACRYYVEHGAAFACVTAGAAGSFAYDGRTLYHAGALDIPIVDTTGAGDNFHGAFLYARGQGWDIQKCLWFSNVFASLTCRGRGGQSAVPTLETVLEYL